MKPAAFHALGIAALDEKIFLFYQNSKNKPGEFTLDYSKDGQKFKRFSDKANIKGLGNASDFSDISSFRISKLGDLYNLLFLQTVDGKTYLCSAHSKDLINFEFTGRLFPITETAVQIPFFVHKNHEVIFFGGKTLNMALSSDSRNWNIHPIDTPKDNYIVGSVKETGEGPLLIYFVKHEHEDHSHFSVWSVLLDKKDPTKVIWSTNKALWMAPQEWIDKDVTPIGVIEIDGICNSYWDFPGMGIFNVRHAAFEKYIEEKTALPHGKLIKHDKNPILFPHSTRKWENKQVFNPAAVLHAGKVHLLYRAVGEGDMSVLGYAVSTDGVTIDARDSKPAYVPREDFEYSKTPGTMTFFSRYMSGGGGYGGIEDPRITKIGDKFYLTYVAYDGRNPPRVALSYITIANFDKKDWKKWSKPVLISPPGEVDKNACILPETIDGKFVIFHRIYPDVLIDKVDSLEDFDGKSVWLNGKYKIHPRPDFWDSNKIGMGPPPIKTKDGWLAIYQGVGFQDNSRYKIGAMLLDLNDPARVLYRSSHPILEPEEFYENGGVKAGVVYPCGAVVLNGKLIVYYGGSDTFIAAATADLDEFLDQLKFDSLPHIDPVSLGNLPNYVETG